MNFSRKTLIRKLSNNFVKRFENDHDNSETNTLKKKPLMHCPQLEISKKLFTLAKSQISTLRSYNRSSWSPDKILKHFKLHFNPINKNANRPDELDTLPDFVESPKHLSSGIDVNSQPPTIEEITKHLQKLESKNVSNDIDSELLKKM